MSDDEFARRAVQVANPVRDVPVPPSTVTATELRQRAERRAALLKMRKRRLAWTLAMLAFVMAVMVGMWLASKLVPLLAT